VQPLRRAIAGEVHKLVSARASDGIVPRAPRTVEGYFGPRSVTWRVHGDFTTMLVGGVSALLLQMLHPAALAGVWDHSNFRRDMAGRLRRTAQFISGTTFGSTEQASELIGRVRKIHDRVSGTLPDGRPYSANDPELLTWVHVAGAWSFLNSYMRYGGRIEPSERDRYFEEMAIIAYKLGATQVPTTEHDAGRYFSDMRPALRVDDRTRIVARALIFQSTPRLALKPFSKLVMNAGIGLLPDWAGRMHGLESRWPTGANDAAVRAVRELTNWALRR
jgi:uncharacterized protein (DUF2236 family)